MPAFRTRSEFSRCAAENPPPRGNCSWRRRGQEEALFGLGMALKADNQLAAAKATFEQLLATSGASRATDARAQIASIDLRLRTAAEAAGVARPQTAGVGTS